VIHSALPVPAVIHGAVRAGSVPSITSAGQPNRRAGVMRGACPGSAGAMAMVEVWAPEAESVEVVVGPCISADGFGIEGGERFPLQKGERGYWRADVEAAGPGADYAYVVTAGGESTPPTPDPRSRWQPYGVHGPSRLVDDAAYAWSDTTWRGLPLTGSVLYELHVGTFTPEGTFDAAVAKLDHLVSLGVDAVELLPCNAFPGRWGWGYDGVDLYAVHDPYGGPEGLKRFVDAAHARGLGVVMDVVYNHLGPAGNYLARFGPYFTDTHVTPWGAAVNLDAPGSDEVRAFLVDNALMWLRDYHIDGLRLDAVHALVDERAKHILEDLAVAVERLGASLRKPLFLIAESDLNDPKLLRAREAGGYGLDAQWTDDVHHSLHATLTGERQGYYVDFGSFPTLAKALTNAFVHDGDFSTFRARSHGRPPHGVPGDRFVVFLQDHDQVGNRATGDRISETLSPGLLKVGAALLLTNAYTPMLWMGEEWGAKTPWQFFTDHDPELGKLVREGRRSEFASHGWKPGDVPDPQDPSTRDDSVLDWSEPERGEHADVLEWYRRLLALRRTRLEFTDPDRSTVRCSYEEDARWFVVTRTGGEGGSAAGSGVVVVCNLGAERQSVPVAGHPVEVLEASAAGAAVQEGSVELDGESVVIARLA
jgi:maltooligosyltrehalose trehalohydrolase